MIRVATPNDAARVVAVYNPYVRETVISFEETPVSADEMRTRIEQVRLRYPWYIAEADGRMLGYAYAAPFHVRPAYKFTVETTVYVARGEEGRGIGTALYKRLINDLRARNLRNAIGIISLPNPASVALHERCGFKKVGEIKSAGRKFERWIDVGYWQLVL